ncbi:fatty acid-binding protein, intestinal-like [Clavelina lepadiformis]|uniref:Lipocalin/cytosolic fatty-acid binding domain-containing protein n=1 Tax=Clavelina lepadiformis TaxID=159417 RepID=A0ABP0FIJ3_CLALP
MAAALQGEWSLDHNENYDDFLKAAGMGAMKRTMAVKLGGSLTITPLGDAKLKVKTVNGPKTKEREIPIGVEFEDEGVDGATAKGKFVFENGKMVGNFITGKGKKLAISREIQNGLLVQTMNFDGTECKRFYKKK